MKALAYSITLVIIVFCGMPTRGDAATIYLSRADWEAANTGFEDVDLSGIPELDTVDAIALPFGQGLGFDTDLQRVAVPTSWASWSGSDEPALLYTISDFSVTSTFLSGPLTGGFGLEVQPDLFGVFPITLTLSDGTTVTRAIDGFGGAMFFGWRGTGIESFSISCQDCGVAFGQMVIAPTATVPEPASLTLMGSGLVLWSLLRRRGVSRRQASMR